MKVVVYGSGVAAASAVRTLLEGDAEVVWLSPGRSGAMPGPAEAGISHGEDAELLYRDTLACGDYAIERDAARALADAASGWRETLADRGVPFARDGRRLPGHSTANSAYVGSVTGPQIARALEISLGRCERVEQLIACDIVVADGRARGVVGIDRRSMKVRRWPADAVVLATSSVMAPFGDPILDVALRAGARMVHGPFRLTPSMLWRSRVAISDGLVAEGARHWFPAEADDPRPAREIPRRERHFVLDERFEGYGSQAPSDLAAHALDEALDEHGIFDRKTKKTRRACYLDITHLPEGHLQPLVGRELQACRAHVNGDPFSDPLLVTSGVVGSLSGIDVDDAHRSTVPNLYAAGSAAARYHGRCALSGNVLLADLHGGDAAARACLDEDPDAAADVGDDGAAEALEARRDEARGRDGELSVRDARDEIDDIANALAFEGDVEAAREGLDAIRERGVACSDASEHGNRSLIARLMLDAELALADAALACLDRGEERSGEERSGEERSGEERSGEGDTRRIVTLTRDGDDHDVDARIIDDGDTPPGPRMHPTEEQRDDG